MNSTIIHDPTFPHGGKYGYILGCTGSHCPAKVACRDVHRRYVGDFAFRRLIDSGMTAADIIAAEHEAHRIAQDALKKPRRTVTAKPPRKALRIDPVAIRDTPHADTIRQLHATGMLDAEIGRQIGLGRRQVTTLRDGLGLKPNRSINTDTIRELHAQGMTDTDMAKEVSKRRPRPVNRRAIAAVRLRLGLAPNPAPVNIAGAFL